MDLPNKMAHLDIMAVDDECEKTEEKNSVPELPARVLRKRKSLTPDSSKPSNRRVCMKPRKHIITENSKQIEAVYLNKKIKPLCRTLETIYEEPKNLSNGTETLIGERKVKRVLTFQLGNKFTKEKIKKRRDKIKKLLGNKTFLNRKKIPMEVFLKSIQCDELDEAIITEIPTTSCDKTA